MLCRDPNDYVRETKKDIFKSNFRIILLVFNNPYFLNNFKLNSSAAKLRPSIASSRGAS